MSYWTKNYKEKNKFESLKTDVKSDVCIIGGGLFGLTTGYYLSKKGLKVTIIEKDNICSKTSGCTTAKITSQHGLFYDYLSKSYGIDFARDYLLANEQAILNIKQIVDEEKIKCDLSKQSSYVFCDRKEDLNLFNQEIATLNRIKNITEDLKKFGFDFDAKFIKEFDIPIKNYGGIEFKNQAMFNPRKYAFGLADCILKMRWDYL